MGGLTNRKTCHYQVGEEKVENEVVLDTPIEFKAFKLPVRNRQGTQPLG